MSNDLMDDLAAAFEEHDTEEDAPSESTVELTAETTETEETTEESTTTETEETAEAAPEVDEEHKAEVEAAKEPEYKTDKAPASWKPQAREEWDKVPEGAKAQIAKREAEINEVLQSSSSARKGMEQLNQTIGPYAASLQAAGYKDPFTAISQLLNTEQTLRSGTTEGKAQLVARLVKDFNVDIGTLDSVLSGQPVQAQGNSQFEDLLNQRLAPYEQERNLREQQRQQEAYQQQEQANQSVAAFSQEKEFLQDVRFDMADMMDMAAKRGQVLSMDEAYMKACAIHPEISKVMAQRDSAASLTGQNDTMAAKRAAAGAQLTGTRVGSGNSTENMSLRDTIADAWNS